jgi:hypothetical protein
MTKFVLLYQGGTMPQTPAEGEKTMADWMAWFGKSGPAVLDMGNAYGPATAVGAQLSDSGTNGYSTVEGANVEAVKALVSDHPHLAAGGRIEIHETLAM